MSVSFIYVPVAFKHMIKFYVVEPIIDFTFFLGNQRYEMKLHRGLFPSRINSKMAFLNMSLLLMFILVVSKTNTQPNWFIITLRSTVRIYFLMITCLLDICLEFTSSISYRILKIP